MSCKTQACAAINAFMEFSGVSSTTNFTSGRSFEESVRLVARTAFEFNPNSAYQEDIMAIAYGVWQELCHDFGFNKKFWEIFPEEYSRVRDDHQTGVLEDLLPDLEPGDSLRIPVYVEESDDGLVSATTRTVTIQKIDDRTIVFQSEEQGWQVGSPSDAVAHASELDKKLRIKQKWKAQWDIPSHSDDDVVHTVSQKHSGEYLCTCMAFKVHKKNPCKHIKDAQNGLVPKRGEYEHPEPGFVLANVGEVTPQYDADGSIQKVQVPLLPFGDDHRWATLIFDCLRFGVSWKTLKERRYIDASSPSRDAIISYIEANGRKVDTEFVTSRGWTNTKSVFPSRDEVNAARGG